MDASDCRLEKILKKLSLVVVFGLVLSVSSARAQWGAPYSNHWIDTGQKYVKISVAAKGFYRIPISALPGEFGSADKSYLQIFHRGREVSIISADEKEIVFYGVPNDGSSDSLFYRPMSGRLNPYSSLYSDKSAYFLTIGKTPGKRIGQAASIQGASPQLYHMENNLTTFNALWSLAQTYVVPDFVNSFFEKGNSMTGERLKSDTLFAFPFKLNNFSTSSGLMPKFRTLMHGMDFYNREVEIYVGKSESSKRKLGSVSLNGLVGAIFESDLKIDDFNATGEGILFIKSISGFPRDRFSIAFQSIIFPQAIKMDGAVVKYFEIPATSDAATQISIEGLKEGDKVYDITDVDNPVVIRRNGTDIVIPRSKNQKLKLLAANNAVNTVVNSDIQPVSFVNLSPSVYNYIIITNETLAESAAKYASYRGSVLGGNYKVLVIKIKDVYNQFNFGEVSPVAIRRFVDYMVSDGNKDKHLFLLGKSISAFELVPKELEDCVPTIGTPASDILTIEGLAGTPKDVPVIPVGRIVADSGKDVEAYLEKVKGYEKEESEGLGWRKRMLHLNGGKNAGEISQFRQVLESLAPMAETGQLGGKVEPVVKQTFIEVEQVDIAPQINSGVGMFTYFGHGSRTKTDLDFGYITDPGRGYIENHRYPFMYFNGCGVGHIFRGAFNTDANAADRRPLSMDWVLTPNKGAVAILANTFSSYVSPSLNYLKKLYETLFLDSATAQSSIGTIQKVTSAKVMSGAVNFYDIANIHQSVLQGDPALRVVNVDKPDYALERQNSIILYSSNPGQTIGGGTNFRTAVIIANLGKYEKGAKVPLKVQYFFRNGTSETVSSVVNAIPYQDTLYINFSNAAKIQKIEATIDVDGTVSEINKANNRADLLIDWDVASALNVYPVGTTKDLISPSLSVTVNNRILKKGEILTPNPSIDIILSDDRILQADSSLVDVFIKKCWDESCNFVRVNYSGGLFKLEAVDSYSVRYRLSSFGLQEGSYELLVTARDISGNVTKAAYHISFKIENSVEKRISVICSPNPATSYLKFALGDYSPDVLKSINFLIYDINGRLLENRNLQIGLKEWYWFPKTAGLLLYKVNFVYGTGAVYEATGKVAVLK